MKEKYLKMNEINNMDEWVIKIYTPENVKKDIIEKINSTAVDLYIESRCKDKINYSN